MKYDWGRTKFGRRTIGAVAVAVAVAIAGEEFRDRRVVFSSSSISFTWASNDTMRFVASNTKVALSVCRIEQVITRRVKQSTEQDNNQDGNVPIGILFCASPWKGYS